MKFAQRFWYCGWRVLKHIVAYAEHIVFHVCVPYDLSDVHRKYVSVHGRDVFVEFLDVFTDEVPLVEGEKLAGPRCHLETPVDFQHPAETEKIVLKHVIKNYPFSTDALYTFAIIDNREFERRT